MITEDVEGLVLSGKSAPKDSCSADTARRTAKTFKISSRTAGIVAVGFLILGLALLYQVRENQGIKASCENYEEISELEKISSGILDFSKARHLKLQFTRIDAGCQKELLDFAKENKICAIKAVNICGG